MTAEADFVAGLAVCGVCGVVLDGLAYAYGNGEVDYWVLCRACGLRVAPEIVSALDADMERCERQARAAATIRPRRRAH
jgi:hypothetical protein